jgi:hypothetical protein
MNDRINHERSYRGWNIVDLKTVDSKLVDLKSIELKLIDLKLVDSESIDSTLDGEQQSAWGF